MHKTEGTRERKKELNEPPIEKRPQKYVVDEQEIREFIGGLSVVHVTTVAARFQIVADLTSGAFEERIDKLDESELNLINRIARENNGERYQRLMTAILSAVEQNRHGINAAHLTARRVVELAFRCTRDYFTALHSFSRNLRLTLIDASPSPGRRRSWKTVSHQ